MKPALLATPDLLVRAACATGYAGDVTVSTATLRHHHFTTDFPQRGLRLEPRT